MTGKTSALYSSYIIDGAAQPLTPGQILMDCCPSGLPLPDDGPFNPVVDETVDLAPSTYKFDGNRFGEYLSMVIGKVSKKRPFPVHFAASHTAGQIARSLLDAIWLGGHFQLGDLSVKAEWRWNPSPIGNMAAFYSSVEAAGAYLDALGIPLSQFRLCETREESSFWARASMHEGTIRDSDDEDDDVEGEDGFFRELPFKTVNPRMVRRRRCPATIRPDSSDWLIYIPFDTCDFRLGGSLLSEAVDARSAVAPDISDADYFIDCYEVARELVEDGVVKAGVTVCDGGLASALGRMVTHETGAAVGISALRRAYANEHPTRVLFAEVPGILIQIDDADYDYVDAELLLQDVAYFPIGHPRPGSSDISVAFDDGNSVSGILESLLQGQAPEGED